MNYYKTEDGKGLIATSEKLEGFIEISKEEFEEIEKSFHKEKKDD